MHQVLKRSMLKGIGSKRNLVLHQFEKDGKRAVLPGNGNVGILCKRAEQGAIPKVPGILFVAGEEPVREPNYLPIAIPGFIVHEDPVFPDEKQGIGFQYYRLEIEEENRSAGLDPKDVIEIGAMGLGNHFLRPAKGFSQGCQLQLMVEPGPKWVRFESMSSLGPFHFAGISLMHGKTFSSRASDLIGPPCFAKAGRLRF